MNVKWFSARTHRIDLSDTVRQNNTTHFTRYQAIMNHLEQIQQRIIELEVEHRDLDMVINAIALDPHHDELQLRRLKKRKLQLKDHITLLKMQMMPDVPAWVFYRPSMIVEYQRK